MSPRAVFLVCLLHGSVHWSSQAVAEDNPAADQLLQFWNDNPVPKNYSTSSGEPVADPLNVMTAGKKGPVLLQDVAFIDDMEHFDRERIPERVVNAKGAGAWGYFTVTSTAITKYTKAVVFNKVGKATRVFCRFSTVSGQSGSTDLFREMRGFSTKFYTEDGNWDLVGLNFPVFWLRDPLLFPSFVHATKKNPVTGTRDWNAAWDFVSLVPSCLLALIMIHTSRGIPKSYRHMHGYGVNTFVLENLYGELFYAKFHFRTNQGIKTWTSQEAVKMSGTDPDYCIKDLYNAIYDGDYPSWNMSVQIMTPDQAEKCPWDILDATKYWPEEMYPLIPVGTLYLNTNPFNYFAEVEQSAFKPCNLIPGLLPSLDRMLQGRLFPYGDAHMYRVGVNYELIPVNKPLGQKVVANRQRDGAFRSGDNQDGTPNYFPNSFNGPVGHPRGTRVNIPIHGNISRHDNSDDDNYSQPTMFWNNLPEYEKKNVVANMALTLKKTKQFIQERVIHLFWRVSEDLGRRLQAALQP